MSALRSEGWSVRPSFAPHGPTQPVTLLFDEAGITQLAGEPAVAWQIPWSEVTNLRLAQRRSTVRIVAVIAGVLYRWRRDAALVPGSFDELRSVLEAHGARETPLARRYSAIIVAVAVTAASFGGYFGGLFDHVTTSPVVTALEALNVAPRDVAGTWASSLASASSILTSLGPPPGQVQFNDPATTTTVAARDSALGLAAQHFQKCLGVESNHDRVYGAAGTTPRYQVSSPVFSSSQFGGVQVESTAQYYDSPQSVGLDVREMSRSSFGRCFVESLADALVGANTASTPDLRTGATLATPTFAKGWVRGGDAAISLPLLQLPRADLVAIVEASGHYEITLYALVLDLSRSRDAILNLTNALLARVTSTSVSA